MSLVDLEAQDVEVRRLVHRLENVTRDEVAAVGSPAADALLLLAGRATADVLADKDDNGDLVSFADSLCDAHDGVLNNVGSEVAVLGFALAFLHPEQVAADGVDLLERLGEVESVLEVLGPWAWRWVGQAVSERSGAIK